MTDNEDPVWKKVKAQTKPLVTKGRITPTAPIEPTVKLRPIRDDGLVKQKKKQQRGILPAREDGHRRVRRGKIILSGQVDLHGMTLEEARESLILFLQQTAGQKSKTVLVITGKGKSGKGALRSALSNWLQSQELSSLVSGYAQAHVRHGGSGAWYIFLRRQ